MEESSSRKRVPIVTGSGSTQEKRHKPEGILMGTTQGENFDDAFGCFKMTAEMREKFFGEKLSEEEKEEKEKEKEKEDKKKDAIIYPTVKPPVYHLCLTPVSTEEQKQKGLYADLTKAPPFEMSIVKPFSFPRKEGEKSLFALKGEDLLAAVRSLPAEEEEKKKTRPTPEKLPAVLFQQPAKPERCRSGEHLSPYCQCSHHARCSPTYSSSIQTLTFVPRGALDEHRPHFIPIWLAYKLQMRQSHCFDIDDHPGSRYGAEVQPLSPSVDFNRKDGVPLELANLAIKEYNENDSNVHKYKVLKIEKVNHSSCFETFKYWMTVKVLNLTLVTPIETFHIHAGLRVGFGEKIIYCCQPKKEVNVGFPCCDVCFGKLDR